MTKVLLINPPRKDYSQAAGFVSYFPLGLLSIAALIKDICEVKILDCLITNFTIKKTDDFALYGMPLEKIRNAIKDFNPNVVGISIPFSAQTSVSSKICKICKEIDSNILVVFGGPDVSVRYKLLLEETQCDFCVIGEGEKTFYEFIKKLNFGASLKDIKGLAYKTNGLIQYKPRAFLENLDELPFPAYNLIDVQAYLANKYLYKDRSELKHSISVITSRGCPFNCIFCSIKLHMGKRYRYHSPDYIIRHLRFLIESYGITNFHFEDDNISLNKTRFEQILDKIIEFKMGISWDAPNGIRADTLDSNLLKKIKKSGGKHLMIAVESGNQHILNDVIKKHTSLNCIINVIRYCKFLKISVGAFYVIGFPGETVKNMEETINLALELFEKFDVFPCLLIATPLYGTELYEICAEKGFIKEDLTDKDFAMATKFYGNPLIATNDFSREDVKKLIHSYLPKFERNMIAYSFRHPVHAFNKIKNKLPVIGRFLKP
jgi:magnesium-protoporphyrin IX monomethyl ester (oxidative) cyclase